MALRMLGVKIYVYLDNMLIEGPSQDEVLHLLYLTTVIVVSWLHPQPQEV